MHVWLVVMGHGARAAGPAARAHVLRPPRGRWGYQTIREVEQVVDNYTAAGIPLETMWTDIDCARPVAITSAPEAALLQAPNTSRDMALPSEGHCSLLCCGPDSNVWCLCLFPFRSPCGGAARK